jgi:hypothetical protein
MVAVRRLPVSRSQAVLPSPGDDPVAEIAEITTNDSKAEKIMSQTQTAAVPSVGTAAPQGRGLRGSPALTLLAVALGVMMVGIDGTIVAVANPAIQSHLHASLAGIQWVSNAYLLALAVSLITAGKLGDRFGHKKVFLSGVAGFAASSAAIGLSGSITLVIAFRAL